MILVADSGSTKTAWRLIDKPGIIAEVTTLGLNPFFRTTEDIIAELKLSLFPVTGTGISHIWFYGAGVVNAEKGEIIKRALIHFYPGAVIETHSDLLGACRALLGKNSGIACILGTGSNACYFDGSTIKDQVPPLGFILGDEGSGAVMGKHLLGDYFKEVMPAELRSIFGKRFRLNKDETLNRVYREERPNQFLASLTPFLSENLAHEYCKSFVEQNFTSFIERNVAKLPGFNESYIGFAGSIAWHFREILKVVLQKYGNNNVLFLKDPIEGLVNFHNQE